MNETRSVYGKVAANNIHVFLYFNIICHNRFSNFTTVDCEIWLSYGAEVGVSRRCPLLLLPSLVDLH